MTAEVAILNSSAVALATDSAITVGKDRVWTNTNKLFSLSPTNDIGVMIYGAGDYCGVPWETVIKLFLHKNNPPYSTVKDCEEDFIKFVSEFEIADDTRKNLNSYVKVVSYTEACFDGEDKIKGNLKARKHIRNNISKILLNITKVKVCDTDTSFEMFLGEFEELIEETVNEATLRHLTADIKRNIGHISYEVFRRAIPSGYETGVVFVGFGHDEVFPSLTSVYIDGGSSFGLRYWGNQSVDLNTDDQVSAYIIPFAQSDMAHLFFEGIQLNYLEFIEETVAGALRKKTNTLVKNYVPEGERVVERGIQSREDKAAIEQLMDDFKKLRQKQSIQPVLSVVSSLPKEEMAAIAEALVEITSLRRKMDSKVQSVGGL